jgi:hypothetical protein
MEELCAGASYAHRMSVIHRDIKPANLMIDRAGRLKILDFGIARVIGMASNTMAMIGTPGYMAPEQIEGDDLDHRADLFSIGVVFYELLSYKEAFSGETMPAITHRVMTQHPAPLAQVAPEVPPATAAIIERLLQKKPADRFESAEATGVEIGQARRSVESDPGWGAAATTVVRRDTPPAAGPGRGTGSARRGVADAVGVAALTPPPDGRTTGRDAIARRRAEQIAAALDQARARIDAHDLDAAFDACQQALTLDEYHREALDLEQAIREALAARDAAEPGEASADSAPVDLASAIPEVEFAAAGADGTAGDVRVAADTAALAGEPTRIVSQPAARVETGDAATVLAPRQRTPAPQPRPAEREPVIPPAETRNEAPAAEARSAPSSPARRIVPAIGRHRRAVMAAAAGALIAVVAAVLWLSRGAGATGTLVVEAMPWASVASVETESGERQPLPDPASTPLSIALRAGDYVVTLTGPPPDLQTQRVDVRVAAGSTIVMPPVRFRTMTVEEYFEPYLSLQTAAPAETEAGQ